MMFAWKSLFPLILVIGFIIFEERISIPSCKEEIISNDEDIVRDEEGGADDVRVMMVANLLLMGSDDAGYINSYFRYSYMAKFFRKSFDRLKPDMLIVLGDVSARGSELTNNKWLSVLQQFQWMLGPFLSLPMHIVVGDRDIGECSRLNAKFVSRIASSLPGLDSAGCGAFKVSNISFVSLNAVAMLCGNNDLRFSVERVIEGEHLDVKSHGKGSAGGASEPRKVESEFTNLGWRENTLSSRSGPVLLLHIPLHRTNNSGGALNVLKRTHSTKSYDVSNSVGNRGFSGTGQYELMQTVPPNATEYIFQALKPRKWFIDPVHAFV
ncbi:metallophosphoesterase 1-like isoform X2 [Papaver somniferum]|uniref:metallophosphoesterase 1-like isoform X2 n=1 Tax=Papaver somniferum TaxID=3469 RepID=UPI000E6FA00A|nr:metallophosphoesterase 1-like isoform X2 [Papaver somniferum]